VVLLWQKNTAELTAEYIIISKEKRRMTTVTYTVPAIHCGHCTHTIEMEVGEMQGVQSVRADQASKKVEITFEAPASEEKIKALLAEINYPAEGLISL
jgi:copper chaperone CopZ